MARDDFIGTDTPGRDTDLSGGSGGPAGGDTQFNAYDETTPTDRPDVADEDVERSELTEQEGTPDDVKLGKRRTVGQDPDAGAGQPDVSGEPGSTGGGT